MRFPLRIELRRSRTLMAGLGVGHFLATAGVMTLPWPYSILAILVCGLLISFWLSLGVLSPYSAIRLDSPERISLCPSATPQEWVQLAFCASAILGPLLVLRFRVADSAKTVPLVLLPDSASTEDLRAVRVWLRCRRGIADSGTG